MKSLVAILIAVLLLSGCVARKIVTVPAKAATKTVIKTTGKVAGGTVKAVTPIGGED